MKGMRLNPDVKHVELIIAGLIKKKGFCPCNFIQDDSTKCPCDEFVETKHCHCNLFVKDE